MGGYQRPDTMDGLDNPFKKHRPFVQTWADTVRPHMYRYLPATHCVKHYALCIDSISSLSAITSEVPPEMIPIEMIRAHKLISFLSHEMAKSRPQSKLHRGSFHPLDLSSTRANHQHGLR